MIPYIALLCVFLFFVCLQQVNHDFCVQHDALLHKICTICFCFCTFLIFALRDYIGDDYAMYARAASDGWGDFWGESHGEYLSSLLVNIATATGDYHVFFALTALVALPLYFYSMYRYPEVPGSSLWGGGMFLAVPMGFIIGLALQRQFVAMGILLFATRYLLKRSLFKYVCCIFIASLFHVSSIIYLILYPLTARKIHLKYLVIIGGCASGIVIIGVKFLASILPFYTAYLSNGMASGSEGYAQLLMYVALAILFFSLRPALQRFSHYDVFLKSYVVGMVLMLGIFPFYAKVGFRVGGVALCNCFFLFPYVFYAFRGNGRLFLRIVFSALFSALFIYGLLANSDMYIPYQTFL